MKSKGSNSASDLFSTFANKAAWAAGSPYAFSLAVTALGAWVACGPVFEYSEGWQLVVNTGTTIVTFLMVFVIQNSQNRDGLAAQIKLDEIIRAVSGAKNSMIDLECLTDKDLADLRVKFAAIADKARKGEEKMGKPQRGLSGDASRAIKKKNGARSKRSLDG